MSRTLRKAVENAKQKKETEINLVEEGIAHLEEVPELCEWWQQKTFAFACVRVLASILFLTVILHNLTKLCLSHNKIAGR